MPNEDWRAILARLTRVARIELMSDAIGSRYLQLAESGEHLALLESGRRTLRVVRLPAGSPVADASHVEAVLELRDGFGAYTESSDVDRPTASEPALRLLRPPAWKPSKAIAFKRNARLCSLSPAGERAALAITRKGPCEIVALPSKERIASFEAPWIHVCWDSRSVLAEGPAGPALFGLDGTPRSVLPRSVALESVRLLAPGIWSTGRRELHLVLAESGHTMHIVTGPPTTSHSLRADGGALRLFARKKPWVIPLDLAAGKAAAPAELAKAGLGDAGSGVFHPCADVVSTPESSRVDWIGGGAALTLPAGNVAHAWSDDGRRLFVLASGEDRERWLDVWA